MAGLGLRSWRAWWDTDREEEPGVNHVVEIKRRCGHCAEKWGWTSRFRKKPSRWRKGKRRQARKAMEQEATQEERSRKERSDGAAIDRVETVL
jgi:hypothetical protein